MRACVCAFARLLNCVRTCLCAQSCFIIHRLADRQGAAGWTCRMRAHSSSRQRCVAADPRSTLHTPALCTQLSWTQTRTFVFGALSLALTLGYQELAIGNCNRQSAIGTAEVLQSSADLHSKLGPGPQHSTLTLGQASHSTLTLGQLSPRSLALSNRQSAQSAMFGVLRSSADLHSTLSPAPQHSPLALSSQP
jgi:hypothetical protein